MKPAVSTFNYGRDTLQKVAEGGSWMWRRVTLIVVLACAFCQASLSERIVATCHVKGLQLVGQPVIDVRGVSKEGTVSLELQVDSDGRVSRVLYANGASQLQEAATRSLSAWRFVRGQNIPTSVWAYVFFTKERGTGGLQPPAAPPPPFGAKLREIDIDGVPSDFRDKVRAVIGVRAGVVLSEIELDRAAAALRRIHPKLRLMLRSGSGGGPKLVIYLEHVTESGSSGSK